MKVTTRHIILFAVIVLAWTAIVIGFSTSMGQRPLRMYDWSPPIFSGLITLIVMLADKKRGK